MVIGQPMTDWGILFLNIRMDINGQPLKPGTREVSKKLHPYRNFRH